MRHRKSKYTLDRKAAARNSLIKNLAQSLVLHEKIKTTKTKAKAVRSLADDLIFGANRMICTEKECCADI